MSDACYQYKVASFLIVFCWQLIVFNLQTNCKTPHKLPGFKIEISNKEIWGTKSMKGTQLNYFSIFSCAPSWTFPSDRSYNLFLFFFGFFLPLFIIISTSIIVVKTVTQVGQEQENIASNNHSTAGPQHHMPGRSEGQGYEETVQSNLPGRLELNKTSFYCETYPGFGFGWNIHFLLDTLCCPGIGWNMWLRWGGCI